MIMMGHCTKVNEFQPLWRWQGSQVLIIQEPKRLFFQTTSPNTSISILNDKTNITNKTSIVEKSINLYDNNIEQFIRILSKKFNDNIFVAR